MLYGTVDSCYNTGNIYCESGYRQYCGGVIGEMRRASLSNSYSIGQVSGDGGTVKNYCGVIGWSDQNNKITNNYCTTEISYNYGYGTWGASKNTANRIEREELKTYALNLGELFKDDIQNPNGTYKYNGGFPILTWQDSNK